MRKRNYCIGVWLNYAEQRCLAELCSVSGLSANAVIRKLILGEQLKPKPPDTFAALLRELSAIGNNLNQLARKANTRGEAAREEIREAVQLAQRAWRLVMETL